MMKNVIISVKVSKEDELWFDYLLDSIQSDIVDVSALGARQKVRLAFKQFYEEMVKNDQRHTYPRVALMRDWLQGLCSTVSVAFIDYDIAQIAKLWGVRNQQKFVERWFDNLASKMFELAKVLGVDTQKYLY